MAQCLHLLETAPFHENGTGRCAAGEALAAVFLPDK